MCTIRGHFGSAPEWVSISSVRYIIHRTTIYYITNTVLCTVYYLQRYIIYRTVEIMVYHMVYMIYHIQYMTYGISYTVNDVPQTDLQRQPTRSQRYFLLFKNLESRLLIWPLESFNIRSSISKIWGKRLSSGEQWVPKRTELRLKILLEILYEDPLWVICNDLNVNLQGEDGSFS